MGGLLPGARLAEPVALEDGGLDLVEGQAGSVHSSGAMRISA